MQDFARSLCHGKPGAAAGLLQAVYECPIQMDPSMRPVLKVLQAIIDGDRNPRLAVTPGLDAEDSHEIALLMRVLNADGL
jgi:hypothetical protein